MNGYICRLGLPENPCANGVFRISQDNHEILRKNLRNTARYAIVNTDETLKPTEQKKSNISSFSFAMME